MNLKDVFKIYGRSGYFLLGLVLCFCACKQRPGGRGDISGVRVAVSKDTGEFVLPDSEVVNLETETEKCLRALGLVEITEVDPSIKVYLVYATDSNFTGAVLYQDLRKAFLLPATARCLSDAQRKLRAERPDCGLIVYDAARPMSVQQQMWEKVKGTDQQVYVSNPAKGGGLHNYGVAVDVSIVDSCGRMLEMGSPFDYFGDEARPDKEAMLVEEGRISRDALKNRLLLRRVMKAAGFRVLHSEWWHFNWMSRDEAKATLQVIP